MVTGKHIQAHLHPPGTHPLKVTGAGGGPPTQPEIMFCYAAIRMILFEEERFFHQTALATSTAMATTPPLSDMPMAQAANFCSKPESSGFHASAEPTWHGHE